MRIRSASLFFGLVGLVVMVAAGCSSTAPVVQLEDAPDTLAVAERGVFEFSYNDDASQPVTLVWDFGDGTVHDSLLTTHRYQEPGMYTVRFMARNDAGSDADSLQVRVERPPQPIQLATLQAAPNPATVDMPVSFATQVRGGPVATYRWTFGDGTVSDEAAPTHRYDAPGTYTVSVEAENAVSTDRRQIQFVVEEPLPRMCTVVQEFNTAFFEANSSTLSDEARASLTENARVLAQCANLTVRVVGHASPTERQATTLAESRAQAVADYYVEQDVAADRIAVSHEVAPRSEQSTKREVSQQRRAVSIPVRDANES